jgi:thiol:disulfide interchange protein DsbD
MTIRLHRLTTNAAAALLSLGAVGSSLAAESPWARKTGAADNLLPAAQAFQLLAAERSGDQLTVTWAIAPGYYLYRKRLGFEVTTPTGATLDTPALPKGETVADEQGTTEVYRETLVARLHARSGTPAVQQLRVHYQGCADAGVCYPPVTALIDIKPAPR